MPNELSIYQSKYIFILNQGTFQAKANQRSCITGANQKITRKS